MDDNDLDDAALWAVIDSAAAAAASNCRFRSSSLLPKHPSPSIQPPLRRPPPDDDDQRGEVLQPARPFKVPRLAAHAPSSPQASPPSPYMSQQAGRRVMVVKSRSPESWMVEAKGKEVAHGLPGQFPSVANFKQYQEIAMSILEKSDFTLISGNPYIKKSGWRKISCFFSISFEIKDRSIEFDENRNVNRAEFVARASMQGGRFSDGWGSCDRREKRFNKPNHDIPSTAETRAKNKACQDLLGIGQNRPG